MEGIYSYSDKKNKRLLNNETMKDCEGKEAIDNNPIDVRFMDEWSDITDEEGVAEFDVEYDDYTATVSKEAYATSTLDVPFREDTNTFTVTMRKFAALTFTVINEMDEPLVNVSVGVGHNAEDRIFGRTDANGQVSFDVEYDNYSYAMSQDGYNVIRGNITFDSEHTEFTVVMVKESGHILTIKALNPDGPADDFIIDIHGEDGMHYWNITDENGICKYDVPHGTYTFLTGDIGYLPVPGTINYTEDRTTFTINLTYALSIIVYGLHEPVIPDVLVHLQSLSGGGTSYEGKTKENGRISFACPADKYNVNFSKIGWQTTEIDISYNGKSQIEAFMLVRSPDRVVPHIVAKDERK